MPLIGYARVSTGDQTLHLQKDALHAAGCIDIYEEYASGARVTRPELAAALRACRKDDTLVLFQINSATSDRCSWVGFPSRSEHVRRFVCCKTFLKEH
jgi:DNA invertase Pin-like site-specific DNA recombinase